MVPNIEAGCLGAGSGTGSCAAAPFRFDDVDDDDDGDCDVDGVRNKSQRTKSQIIIWYFVRLITIIFISNSNDMLGVCTGSNNHY